MKRKVPYILIILIGSFIIPIILFFLREHEIASICLKYIIIPIVCLYILFLLLKNGNNKLSRH